MNEILFFPGSFGLLVFAGVGPALVNSSSSVFVEATQVTHMCARGRGRELVRRRKTTWE